MHILEIKERTKALKVNIGLYATSVFGYILTYQKFNQMKTNAYHVTKVFLKQKENITLTCISISPFSPYIPVLTYYIIFWSCKLFHFISKNIFDFMKRNVRSMCMYMQFKCYQFSSLLILQVSIKQILNNWIDFKYSYTTITIQ